MARNYFSSVGVQCSQRFTYVRLDQNGAGECGFLNNSSAIVMALLPAPANKRPRLGEVETVPIWFNAKNKKHRQSDLGVDESCCF